MQIKKLSPIVICIIALIYFSPFFYCLAISLSKADTRYENQFVWYYLVTFVPMLIVYVFIKSLR